MAGEADGADGYKADKAERQLHVAHHTNTMYRLLKIKSILILSISISADRRKQKRGEKFPN